MPIKSFVFEIYCLRAYDSIILFCGTNEKYFEKEIQRNFIKKKTGYQAKMVLEFKQIRNWKTSEPKSLFRRSRSSSVIIEFI